MISFSVPCTEIGHFLLWTRSPDCYRVSCNPEVKNLWSEAIRHASLGTDFLSLKGTGDTGGVEQLTERLPSIPESLGLIISTAMYQMKLPIILALEVEKGEFKVRLDHKRLVSRKEIRARIIATYNPIIGETQLRGS